MSNYADLIRETMIRIGRVGAADPRLVMAWMLVEHPTLDGLSRKQFVAEVSVALQCIAAATTSDSEALAASYGL